LGFRPKTKRKIQLKKRVKSFKGFSLSRWSWAEPGPKSVAPGAGRWRSSRSRATPRPGGRGGPALRPFCKLCRGPAGRVARASYQILLLFHKTTLRAPRAALAAPAGADEVLLVNERGADRGHAHERSLQFGGER
jgi:hypothetical protein